MRTVTSLLCTEACEAEGQHYVAGTVYTVDPGLLGRLLAYRRGKFRVMTERVDVPRRDRMLHNEGIRHG